MAEQAGKQVAAGESLLYKAVLRNRALKRARRLAALAIFGTPVAAAAIFIALNPDISFVATWKAQLIIVKGLILISIACTAYQLVNILLNVGGKEKMEARKERFSVALGCLIIFVAAGLIDRGFVRQDRPLVRKTGLEWPGTEGNPFADKPYETAGRVSTGNHVPPPAPAVRVRPPGKVWARTTSTS